MLPPLGQFVFLAGHGPELAQLLHGMAGVILGGQRLGHQLTLLFHGLLRLGQHRPALAHRIGLGTQFAKGVERRAMRRHIDQRPVIVLAVDFHDLAAHLLQQ
ncbi:hypothetical protein D3C87_1568330 [compost metagenome]